MRGYRERRIRSFKELRRAVEALELDQGIRIISRPKGSSSEGFLFITKPADRYCINICERVYDKALSAYIPGGREEWIYSKNLEEILKKVSALAKRPLQAWIY